jgi:hypothetical protein
MKNLEHLIAMATRHVDEGRRIVAEQRKRVADNNAGPDAAGLLQTFERSLEIFEYDLDGLLRERAEK